MASTVVVAEAAVAPTATVTVAVVERQMGEEFQAQGEGGGSLASHKEVERQYLLRLL